VRELIAAAQLMREVIAADGTWMIVEPAAGDRVKASLNPVGRAYYAFSTLLCGPASLWQEVGLALGAEAGEAVKSRPFFTHPGAPRIYKNRPCCRRGTKNV
jgi:hypothetical protein